MKNSKGEIRGLEKEIGKGEFELLTIGRSESQQEIDTRIDLLDDESRKKERSVGIHELERDVDQNYGGLREIWPGGEYLDHHPIPKVVGR